MGIELKNIDGVFWIDREEAVKHLTNGFVELFGEENRDFFESLQDKMIDEGIKAAKDAKGFRRKCFGRMSMCRMTKKYNTDEENELLKKWFLKFFTEEEYDIVYNEKRDKLTDWASDSVHKLYKNTDNYKNLFVNRFSVVKCDKNCQLDECYCNSEPPKLYKKSPPSFKYFKKIRHSFLGINMFGEGGMSLDRWDKRELNYMLEEGEWFYYPESIHRSYYYLGAQIGKCQLKEEFFNEIIEKVEPETPEKIQLILKSSLEALSTDYDENVLVPLIREVLTKKFDNEIKLDGFETHKEITESLNNIYKKLEDE